MNFSSIIHRVGRSWDGVSFFLCLAALLAGGFVLVPAIQHQAGHGGQPDTEQVFPLPAG